MSWWGLAFAACLWPPTDPVAPAPPRPEPLPVRLQAPLLRPLHLPAAVGARLAAPATVERTTLLTVAVFRESDAGRSDLQTQVTLVGDAVVGLGRLRYGLPATGAWRGEYGFEVAGLRYGRSPKFRDEGPVVQASYRGVDWLDVREPQSGMLAPVAWAAGGWRGRNGAGALLRATVAWASGSRHRATGTREWGGSLSAIGGGPLGGGLFLDASVGAIWPGSPDGLHGGHVHLDTLWQGMLALSWAIGAQWSLHLQALVATNPFPRAHASRLDEFAGEVVIGARWWPWPEIGVSLTFGEDLSRLAPDFSVGLGLEYRLRAGAR